ncbi:unnamed protein product [Hymenolepis diminuta]|uniref:DUF7041 domain-containing protein n=1 Tax=Hymenolepis diminuta TaxID=6216 RepID=A0A564YBC7_HYMDI|nr:unnamed protein product [Hymenolepis diminuta]
MANDSITPTFTKQYAPESFLCLETQFHDYEIISQKVRFTRLLNNLTPEVAKPVYDVLEKPSTAPYDKLKFAILETMEEQKLENSTWLHNELMNGDGKGPQPQEENNSDPDPPQTDSDSSSSTIITPETDFDSEQRHTYNRERCKKLPFIVGDPNSKQG